MPNCANQSPKHEPKHDKSLKRNRTQLSSIMRTKATTRATTATTGTSEHFRLSNWVKTRSKTLASVAETQYLQESHCQDKIVCPVASVKMEHTRHPPCRLALKSIKRRKRKRHDQLVSCNQQLLVLVGATILIQQVSGILLANASHQQRQEQLVKRSIEGKFTSLQPIN